MRRCNKCDAPICPVQHAGKPPPFSQAFADPDGTPISLIVMYECFCGSHQSVVLWECEELAEASFEEAELADDYQREFGAGDRAATRGFFSLTHELAELCP